MLDLACRGAVPFSRVAEVLAANPARIFGVDDRKGDLHVGLDGDLVLIDPELEKTVTSAMVRSKAGRSVFEGTTLKGWPVLTALRGEIVFSAEHELTPASRGRFVARSAN